MRDVVARGSSVLALGALAVLLARCGSSGNVGDDAGEGDDATVAQDGPSGDDANAGGDGTSSESSGSSGGDGSVHTGPVTCGTPASYQMNASACGTFRWALKTGTDTDTSKVNMTPQASSIATLVALPTLVGQNCTRATPEKQLYQLTDVNIRFERLESDGDYHLVLISPQGQTMIGEVPYPPCIGHDMCTGGSNAWLCEITHARAAVDEKDPGAVYGELGVGTVIGPVFFDTYELNMATRPAGMAANGAEIHPILAICFGKGCDPLAGY